MKSKKILIIDDDRDILELLNIVLTDAGYQVETLDSGRYANLIPEIAPDLLLLDLRMDGNKNAGAEICIRLKTGKHTRHIPVILISAEHNIAITADACGANGFIKKPFCIDDIVSVADSTIGGHCKVNI